MKFSKLMNGLLSACMFLSSAIVMNEMKAEAIEVQPYAQIINRDVDYDSEYFVQVENGPVEYAMVLIHGTYQHNINGSTSFPSNINISVTLKRSTSYTDQGIGATTGSYRLSIQNINYSTSGSKLIIKYTLKAETFDRKHFNLYNKTITY